MSSRAHHILYEGTRGSGKTEGQLMYFRQFVGRGYGQFWRGIILDRQYKRLDDVVSRSLRWFPRFNDGARFLYGNKDYKWVWPTGEELLFRKLSKKDEYHGYHGHEYPFIGWNELTNQPTPELYDLMMSCNRSSHRDDRLPSIPLVVFSTTNPHGAGHAWVKERFVDPAPPGQVVRTTRDVFNPRTQRREEHTKYQVRIFGSYKENRLLSPEYIAELEAIKDDNLRRAWLHGDWDVVAGSAFDDLWDSGQHIIAPVAVPKSWYVDRSFDWGSSHPFSVGWWAKADGTEAHYLDGTGTFCPPAGSLIRIAEWYGSNAPGTNTGLRMSAKNVARGIVERETVLRHKGVVAGKIYPGPADGSIYSVNDVGSKSIADMMEEEGVTWLMADRSNGSRAIGLQAARDMLEAVIDAEGPGLFVSRDCQAWIKLVPHLPRDERLLDDVDTDAEDHAWDETRYRVLARKQFARRIQGGTRY